MEHNFSIGTYSISSDGVSINYSAPSLVSKETFDKIKIENDELINEEEDNSSDLVSTAKESISAPKGKDHE